MPKSWFYAVFLAVLSGTTNASAAVFCAPTTSLIRQALATAESNGEADTIRINIGTYVPANGTAAFTYSTTESHAVTIEGGWNFGCTQRVDRADLTVLGGAGERRVLRINASGSGAVTVRNLTLEDGESTTRGAGLSIENSGFDFTPPFAGNVVVERVVFLFNRTAAEAGALAISTSGNSITVRGNLFAFNRCSDDNCALLINSRNDTPSTVRFGGNTVAFNSCNLGVPLCDSRGARFTGPQNVVIYNNLFAFHSGGDISLQNPSVEADLYYNNFNALIGSADIEVGTVNVTNPEFVDALAEDFRLQPTSPLRNIGNAPFPLPSVDLDGKPRIVGSAPDLGAYEVPDTLFADGFDGDPS